jgi:putative transposon-encoded protein
MLVFEGKISRWGQRGYVIYVPREYEEVAKKYHGEKVVVIILRKGENP